MTLQNGDFFDLQSVHEEPTYHAFSPFQFASILNDHRMVNVVFFHNFDDGSWLLSAAHGGPLHSSSSRLLSPL